jgi:hypothetical protein
VQEEKKVEEIKQEQEDAMVASVDDFIALRPQQPTIERSKPARPKPQHGGQQRLSQHGGQQRPPQHGGQQRKPQHGGQQKLPQH